MDRAQKIAESAEAMDPYGEAALNVRDAACYSVYYHIGNKWAQCSKHERGSSLPSCKKFKKIELVPNFARCWPALSPGGARQLENVAAPRGAGGASRALALADLVPSPSARSKAQF